MSQDALIAMDVPGLRKNSLTEIAERHLAHLRAQGVLKVEHELLAATVLQLATIAGNTVKGYAAAQVFRELREAIAALPQIEHADPAADDLAAELEALGHDA